MSGRDRSRISVEDEDGRCVAEADIEVVSRSEVRASLHVEAGHLPSGTRTRLVDAVLDAPEVSSCEHVQVALPMGETEILDRVRERCDAEEVRAAGATCLVEAEIVGRPVVGTGSDAGEASSSG